MSIIECDHVSKSHCVKETEAGFQNVIGSFFHPHYRAVHAVKDISFRIERSQILGLIGENGAGKTTIIKMICGILSPDFGCIRVLDADPFKKSRDFKRRVSLLLGNKNQLWWDLPAHESFLVTKKLYGLSDCDYRNTLEELVDLLGISPFINSPIKNLSLGQRMRCELVNALLFKPELILLDEPTLGLDLRSQIIIRNYIKQYIKKHNAACVVTSHYIKDITDLTTDVAILHKGQQIYFSSTDEFLLICADHSIVEVEGQHRDEINRATQFHCYQHNDSTRIFARTSEIPRVMSHLIHIPGCGSVKVLDASIDDLVENRVLSIQYEDEDHVSDS